MVQTKHLQPGMTLQSDVRDSSGRLLVTANTVLTRQHITVLKTWGITEASIKDGSTEEKPPQQRITSPTDAAIEQALEMANHLFSLANHQHPAMQQLFDISVQHIAIELDNGQKRDKHV